MNKKRKKAINEIISNILDPKKYSIIKIIIVVSIVVSANIWGTESLKEYFKIETVMTLSITFVITAIGAAYLSYQKNRHEDMKKLTFEYDSLVKKYAYDKQNKIDGLDRNIDLVKTNVDENIKNINKILKKSICKVNLLTKKTLDSTSSNEYIFPVEILHTNNPQSIYKVIDKSELFEPDELIYKNYDKIFDAHAGSKKYNNLMIRLDDVKIDNNDISLFTSRTTYYHSLVCNRAMDYDFSNGLTIRDLYEYGPRLNSLSNSRLSNHIGINAVLVTADFKIPAIMRFTKEVTIAKHTLGFGVAGALKSKYALNSGVFSVEGLIDGLYGELNDEFGIDRDLVSNALTLKDNLITIYRDYLEGGKPQFLFKIKLKINHKEMLEIFNKYKKKSKSLLSRDGNKLMFFEIEDLQNAVIAPDMIYFNGSIKKKYDVFPSTSASVKMFLDNYSS